MLGSGEVCRPSERQSQIPQAEIAEQATTTINRNHCDNDLSIFIRALLSFSIFSETHYRGSHGSGYFGDHFILPIMEL